MDFIAIDVETANMASICQIGIAHFSNGALAREWKTYVNPKDQFARMNVAIDGITEKYVSNAPTFAAIASTLHVSLNGRIIVTHTSFDKLAIMQAASLCGAPFPGCVWLDSARVVRRSWTQFSKSGCGLQNVCMSMGYGRLGTNSFQSAEPVFSDFVQRSGGRHLG